MELNSWHDNFFKIVIHAVDKNKIGLNCMYEFEGDAYIVFRKDDLELVFNTFLITNPELIGSCHGIWGGKFNISKNEELWEYRSKNFEQCKSSSKTPAKFTGDIKELNNLFLKNKLTIKNCIGFIKTSNASGGLLDPYAEELKAIISGNDLKNLNEALEGYINNSETRYWNIFSSLSNTVGSSNKNNGIKKDITISDLEKIETRSLKELFKKDENNEFIYKVVIVDGKKDDVDYHLPLPNAIATQNKHNLLSEEMVSEYSIMSKKERKKISLEQKIERIKNWSSMQRKHIVKINIRSIWSDFVEEVIHKNNLDSDFYKGTKKYDRAHIIGNAYVADKLLYYSDDDENFMKWMNIGINKNNFILMTKTIHKYWDDGLIGVDLDGNIFNVSLSQEDFEKEIGKYNKILDNYISEINDTKVDFLRYRLEIKK